MAGTWLRLALRAELRRHWRPMLMLAMLLGLTGGVVLTAAAGAERTSTAYPRLLQWAHASQLDLVSDSGTPAAFYRRLRALPGVAAISRSAYYDTLLPATPGRPQLSVATWASPDGTMGVTMDRVKVLAGRPFAVGRTGAAMVDPQLAARDHLRPGSTLRLLVVPSSAAGIADPRRAVPMTFRVTAIVVLDNEVVPADAVAAQPTALLSPDFTSTPAARAASFGDQAAVRLRPGASRPRFVRAAAALARDYPAARGLNVVDLADQATATERAIRPQAVALAAFAAATGLIALAVLGQLLARQLALDAVEYPALRALGVTRAGRAALSVARLACVTVAGGVLAGAVAVAASPLMPVGPARLAEPRPGVVFTPAILGPGIALLVMLPLALLAPVAWRVASRPEPPAGRAAPGTAGSSRDGAGGRGAGWAGTLSPVLPPAGAIGVRMALEPGRGRTAVPVRSALAGMIVATAAVVAATVFGASFLHLISTPRLYGQDWQQELDLGFGGIPRSLVTRLMAAQPRLAGYAAGNYGQISLDGLVVPAIGLDPVRGAGYLTLLSGRAPARPDEIALGAQTLREVHARLGQQVQAVIHGRPRPMRIVGVTVLAGFGLGTVVTTDLGSGAVVTAPVLSTPAPQSGCPARFTCYNFMLARYQAGTAMRAAAARLDRTVARLCPPQACTVTADQRPGEIRHYTSVRDTPAVLGALLALLAAGTLSHVLLTSVRRRRRDFAVLRVLGLVRGQVLAVVAGQGLTVAVIALLAGIPLGLLAGRWAWALFAAEAGVRPGATIPVPLVLLAIPAVLALAVVLAVWPGRAAARGRPAAELRAE